MPSRIKKALKKVVKTADVVGMNVASGFGIPPEEYVKIRTTKSKIRGTRGKKKKKGAHIRKRTKYK